MPMFFVVLPVVNHAVIADCCTGYLLRYHMNHARTAKATPHHQR